MATASRADPDERPHGHHAHDRLRPVAAGVRRPRRGLAGVTSIRDGTLHRLTADHTHRAEAGRGGPPDAGAGGPLAAGARPVQVRRGRPRRRVRGHPQGPPPGERRPVALLRRPDAGGGQRADQGVGRRDVGGGRSPEPGGGRQRRRRPGQHHGRGGPLPGRAGSGDRQSAELPALPADEDAAVRGDREAVGRAVEAPAARPAPRPCRGRSRAPGRPCRRPPPRPPSAVQATASGTLFSRTKRTSRPIVGCQMRTVRSSLTDATIGGASSVAGPHRQVVDRPRVVRQRADQRRPVPRPTAAGSRRARGEQLRAAGQEHHGEHAARVALQGFATVTVAGRRECRRSRPRRP